MMKETGFKEDMLGIFFAAAVFETRCTAHKKVGVFGSLVKFTENDYGKSSHHSDVISWK